MSSRDFATNSLHPSSLKTATCAQPLKFEKVIGFAGECDFPHL